MEKREFTQGERDSAASSGAALPDGSFPIHNKSDLANAIRAFGRAKDPAKAKTHIKARARALGASDMIPDSWKSDSSGDVAMKEGAEVVFRDNSTSPAAGWVGKAVGTVIVRREIPGLKTASLDVEFDAETYKGVVEGIPESQLLTFHDFEREEIRLATGGMDPDNLIDLLTKAGIRHSGSDRMHLQKAHDHLAAVAGGAHCDGADQKAAKAALAELEKAGSKFTAGDVIKIGTAHDACKALGAKCNSTVSKDS